MEGFAKNLGSNMQNIAKIKALCGEILKNPRNIENFPQLQILINATSPQILRAIQPIVLTIFYPIMKIISTDDVSNYKTSEKQLIVDILRGLLNKIIIDNSSLFFNIYGFLLYEIYDFKKHSVRPISEEYKLCIVECMISLSKSLSSSVLTEIYVKNNSPKLCQMIFVLKEMAKNEQYKSLRISCITCIMALARVQTEDDFNDLVIRDQIAEVFLFFLPGVATQLKMIALSDEKVGHKIPSVALRAWGRIVTLMMQDYNASDRQKLTISEIFELAKSKNPYKTKDDKKQFKDEKEMNEYLDNMKRSPDWYKETDQKLQKFITDFYKLTHHSHPTVRLELARMASLIINNCMQTMPSSITSLVEIVIALSGDGDNTVSSKSQKILQDLSIQFTQNELKTLCENLEDGFYNAIMSLPRKFNGIDENEQLSSLNLLIGYITLFEKHNLSRILHSTVHLNQLLETLIHISELDKSDVCTLEEYFTQDLELTNLQTQTPWKKFRCFRETSIRLKIEVICKLLAKFGASQIISHFLLDKFVEEPVNRKEVTFLLNELATGIESNDEGLIIFQNIISTYIDSNYWYPQLRVRVDDDGYGHTLGDVQSNIVQVCLLVEGVGKIASTMGNKFDKMFMLKTFYLVLERAGSGHPLIRAAGATTLSNIAQSCGYDNISQLMTSNIDYFSFYVTRKLHKSQIDRGVLSVVAVVMKYSSIDVLTLTSDMVNELLIQCCDKRREDSVNDYLNIFKMFTQSVHKWLDIEVKPEPFKTKKEKLEEYQQYKVSGIDENFDFSNDKSGEEMFKEDMAKNPEDLDEEIYSDNNDEAFKKSEPPIHIKLTVTLLSKILHFLPSKDRNRKLLVIEILKDGLEIIRDWENDLLPIVHQIWSPLVDRFKEVDDCLIGNHSFQLLVTLGRLSKDFINSRTAKDILPHIVKIMEQLSEESYLKDKGSAYRYTQKYKLQLTVLENLPSLVTNVDFKEEDISTVMKTVIKYLNDKQPLPLQAASITFFNTILKYDPDVVSGRMKDLTQELGIEFSKNLTVINV